MQTSPMRWRWRCTSTGKRCRFVVVSSEDGLEQALAAPLDLWRVLLRPDQRASAGAVGWTGAEWVERARERLW